jgi:hypothetical protein
MYLEVKFKIYYKYLHSIIETGNGGGCRWRICNGGGFAMVVRYGSCLILGYEGMENGGLFHLNLQVV